MSLILVLALSLSSKAVYANEKYNVNQNLEYIHTQALNIYNGSTKIFNKNNVDITNDFIKRFPTKFHLKDNAINEILDEKYYIVETLLQEDNKLYRDSIIPHGLVNHSYSRKVTQTTSTYDNELLEEPANVTVSYLIRGTVTEDSNTGKIASFSSPFVTLTYSSVAINKFRATTSTPSYLPGNYGIRISASVNFMYLFDANPGLEIPVRTLRYSFNYYPSAQ